MPQADWGPDDYPADTQVIVASVHPVPDHVVARGARTRSTARTSSRGAGGAWHVHATDSSGRLWGRYTRGFVLLNAAVTLPAGFAAVGPSGPRGREIMHELGRLVGLDHPRLADPAQVGVPPADPPPWPLGERGPDRPAPGRRDRRLPPRPQLPPAT